MTKLLRIKDRILLGLAIAGDIFWEIKTVHGIAGTSYQNAYGFTPDRYKKTNYSQTVSRLLRSGQIEKKTVNGEPYLEIASKGQRKVVRSFPLIHFQSMRWDKKFRVLTFDVPEKSKDKRDSLRHKLVELGFGMMQKSVYISPFPIEDDMREFLEDNDLDNFSYVFVVSMEDLGNVSNLVERVWMISHINDDYADLIANFRKEGSAAKFKTLYLDLLVRDPFLPKELLPSDWSGDLAKSLFRKLLQTSTK